MAIFSLSASQVLGQKDKKESIALIPLRSENIIIRTYVQKILGHNKISVEIAREIIKRIAEEEFKSVFSNYNTVILDEKAHPRIVLDTVSRYQLYSCFRFDKSKSEGEDHRRIEHVQSYESEYYGLVLDSLSLALIKKLGERFDLVVTLNRMETITKRPFQNNTNTILHGDVFDDSGKRVLGANKYRSDIVAKNMYFDVFKHYFRTVCRSYFMEIKSNEKL